MQIIRFLDENGHIRFGHDYRDGEATLPAPVQPSAILCIGLNYSQHDRETNTEFPQYHVLFMKNPAALNHPNDPILLPPSCLDPLTWFLIHSSCRLQCYLNGELMQDANTSFSVAELIEYLSDGMTLLPGTVIMSGTPSGVGFARQPSVFLKPGDSPEVRIDNLGTLSHPVAETG